MKRTDLVIKIILAVLAAALIVLLAAFLREYAELKKLEIVSPRDAFVNIANHHGPFTAKDVPLIQGWMTFDYVNKIFNLPPDYLKTSLGISDARYPQEVIFKYAGRAHENVSALVGQIQNLVRSFLTNRQ